MQDEIETVYTKDFNCICIVQFILKIRKEYAKVISDKAEKWICKFYYNMPFFIWKNSQEKAIVQQDLKDQSLGHNENRVLPLLE